MAESVSEIISKSIKSGLGGAGAMTCQVTTLMWMRTIMNYQYRYGGTIYNTINKLYNDSGIRRFYRGFSVALIQGPMSRFGDTFSNTLALSMCKNNKMLKDMPIFLQTAIASSTAGLFRILLMPIDTTKTILQVEGKNGLNILKNKIKIGGPRILYYGSIATSSATIVGHYPWFMVYNYMDNYLSKYENKLHMFLRNASIGFIASIASDTISNSLRVIKTTKQSYNKEISYKDIIKEIIKKDGTQGLFGRGLPIRLMTNGIQGLMFSVIWKYLESMKF